jgi:hypothetical protein
MVQRSKTPVGPCAARCGGIWQARAVMAAAVPRQSVRSTTRRMRDALVPAGDGCGAGAMPRCQDGDGFLNGGVGIGGPAKNAANAPVMLRRGWLLRHFIALLGVAVANAVPRRNRLTHRCACLSETSVAAG